jgi:hypothetical protein
MIRTRTLDLAVSMFLTAFGIFIAYEGLSYGYLDKGSPGAGFFPVWIGVGLLGFAATNLVRESRRAGTVEIIAGTEIAKVVLCTLAMIGFVALSPLIGMIAAGFILMFAIGAIFGPRKLGFYTLLAVICGVMTGALYVVFSVLLAVPLI